MACWKRLRCVFWSVLALTVVSPAWAQSPMRCELRFTMSGWSIFYKTAQGSGVIHCRNGLTVPVKIHAKGGGLTVGKSEITNGHGTFHGDYRLQDLFGTYGGADAHAGVVKSRNAQVVTKDKISLTLTGKGKGFDLGVGFGNFIIERR